MLPDRALHVWIVPCLPSMVSLSDRPRAAPLRRRLAQSGNWARRRPHFGSGRVRALRRRRRRSQPGQKFPPFRFQSQIPCPPPRAASGLPPRTAIPAARNSWSGCSGLSPRQGGTVSLAIADAVGTKSMRLRHGRAAGAGDQSAVVLKQVNFVLEGFP